MNITLDLLVAADDQATEESMRVYRFQTEGYQCVVVYSVSQAKITVYDSLGVTEYDTCAFPSGIQNTCLQAAVMNMGD